MPYLSAFPRRDATLERHRRCAGSSGIRGQSLVEFAFLVPVILLILLIAIDFGRLYASWVTLNNSARVAANYAAANPHASFAAGSTYATLVNGEGFGALGSTCSVSGGVPAPVFADTSVDANTTTTNLGDTATVSVSCAFKVITPFISLVVGSSVPLTASSTFTIRTGAYLP
ncbi:MAG: pilus assembly protein [Chloroflexi bacterium]|nr:pilus assembly protein [Chloroflexota bacterium]